MSKSNSTRPFPYTYSPLDEEQQVRESKLPKGRLLWVLTCLLSTIFGALMTYGVTHYKIRIDIHSKGFFHESMFPFRLGHVCQSLEPRLSKTSHLVSWIEVPWYSDKRYTSSDPSDPNGSIWDDLDPSMR